MHARPSCGPAAPPKPEPAGATVLVARRWRLYDSVVSDAIAFDTHRFVKRLTESGFTEKQAETLADEQIALFNTNLATKGDIAGIKTDIAEIKANLLKWLIGALIAQGGLVVALVKLL